MDFLNLPDFFSSHRKIIREFIDNWDSYQIPLIEASHIAPDFIDYSQLLPNYSLLYDSIADQINEVIEVIKIAPVFPVIDTEALLQTSQLIRHQVLQDQRAFYQMHAGLIQNLLSTSVQVELMQDSLRAVYNDILVTELRILSTLAESPVLTQLGRNLITSVQFPSVEFGEGLLNDLSRLLQDISDNQSSQLDDGMISEIEDRFATHVHNIKKGQITAKGIAQVIRDLIALLSLIISWLSLQSSYDAGRPLEETQHTLITINDQINSQIIYLKLLEQSTDDLESQLETMHGEQDLTNQHLETIVNLGQRLMPYVEQAIGPSEEEIILVAKRSIPLRTEPSRNGGIITRIYPNQQVAQLKREKDWVYIEYFDYNESVPKTGWVYRWNLVLLGN